MGLFDKKYCDICGEKIGLFGTRKLEDGKICKECAGKLSPWFDDRRHSTLEEIKGQLQYREENRKALDDFHCTQDLGEYYRVLFDEEAGTFVISYNRSASDFKTPNPDIFRLDQVTGAKLDISDSRTELYTTDKDGNRESYNPPRYRYSYRFYIEITMNHPYVDEIRFPLNEYALEIERQDRGFSLFSDSFNPDRDYDYRSYRQMGEEIVKKLKSGGRKPQAAPQETVEAPAAEPETVVCPYCGTRVKRGRFCENCGGKLD